MSSLSCALALLAAASLPAAASDGWPSLPDGTTSVLLLTGEDRGYKNPASCGGGTGGALYRETLDGWLSERRAGVERIWVGAGGVDRFEEGGSTVPLDELLALYGQVGYDAVSPGVNDVKSLIEGAGLAAARAAPFPLLAANLRVFETGDPLFDAATVVSSRSGRIGFIGVLPYDGEAVWGNPGLGTVLLEETVPAVRQAVQALRGKADLIVLLASLSHTELEELLRSVEGIDIAASGRSGVAHMEPEEMAGVPVLWLGWQGHYLGRVALGPAGKLLSIDAVRIDLDFMIDPWTGTLKETADRASGAERELSELR